MIPPILKGGRLTLDDLHEFEARPENQDKYYTPRPQHFSTLTIAGPICVYGPSSNHR